MPVIVIANPKGGSCKSTLATHVAGMLAREGLSVMLGDVDRQQSARQWLAMRPAEVPPIQSWDLDGDQVLRPPRGTTHVVVDTPAGLQGDLLETLLKAADKVLVPVQASLFDTPAADEVLETERIVPEPLAEEQTAPMPVVEEIPEYEYEYIDDTSGLEAEEEPAPAPRRSRAPRPIAATAWSR